MSRVTISSFAISSSIFIFLCTIFFFFPNPTDAQTTTLSPGQTLTFIGELKSSNGIFKLSFFTPEPGTYFLGISYTGYLKTLWVANRTVPITDLNVNLTMDGNGVLGINQNGKASIVLNSNSAAVNSVASLEDSGNFVVYEVDVNGVKRGMLWQSFDYPTDTLFPSMRLGKEVTTGRVWRLTSWLTETNPAPGVFTMEWEVTVNGTVELVINRRGEVYWTSGLLEMDNRVFQNLPMLSENFLANDYQFHYVSNSSESTFFYTVIGDRKWWWMMGSSGRVSDSSMI